MTDYDEMLEEEDKRDRQRHDDKLEELRELQLRYKELNDFNSSQCAKLLKENEGLKAQIEKMKNCLNCKHCTTDCAGFMTCNAQVFYDCKSNNTFSHRLIDYDVDYWELAE